jgi:hypothetical protein
VRLSGPTFLAACVLVCCAACGPNVRLGSNAPTTRATPVSTSTTVPTTSTSTASIAVTTPQPWCGPSQLQVTIPNVGVGVGMVEAFIEFQNVGESPCTMQGYPSITGLNMAGAPVSQAVLFPPDGGGSAFVLAPMEIASAGVYTDENQIGSNPCIELPALLVTPPHTTQSVRVAVYTGGISALIHACMALSVGPVYPGTTPGSWQPDRISRSRRIQVGSQITSVQ